MKKVFVSIFLFIFGICLVGCETIVEYVPLSIITKDEEFISAYVSAVNGDSEVLIVDFNELKEEDFYKNIMNSSAKPTDVLPEEISTYSLVIKSDNNTLHFECMSDLYAQYNDKCYLIECSKADLNELKKYLNPYKDEIYELTIQNDSSNEISGIKEEYKVGEEVEVKMFYEKDVLTYVFLNGELLGSLNGINSLKFNMPAKDSTLVLTYENDKIYRASVIDNFNLLKEPLKKYYNAGETVKVITKFLSGPKIDVQVDGQFLDIKEEGLDFDYEFIMPEKDVEIIILYNGFINKPCENDEHQWDEGIEIYTGTGEYILEYSCQLCGTKKRENITIVPSKNETLSDFLITVNPNFVYLNSDINDVEKKSSYNDFKEQVFFNIFSQIELNELNDNIDYDISQVDYYIKFVNTQTNEFVILELFDVLNNNQYFYGWLKTSYLNGIFEFGIDSNLFKEIYDYFINDIETVNYYVFEDGNYIEVSNYSCRKIVNIILESEEITYTKSEIEALVWDLSITTYEPPIDVYPFEMTKYNYVWQLDYETGIAEVCTIAPTFSSIRWPNRYFELSKEEVIEIKNNLSK